MAPLQKAAIPASLQTRSKRLAASIASAKLRQANNKSDQDASDEETHDKDEGSSQEEQGYLKEEDEDENEARPAKRRKTTIAVKLTKSRRITTGTAHAKNGPSKIVEKITSATTRDLCQRILDTQPPPEHQEPCLPSLTQGGRPHTLIYHHPLLLLNPSARESLLSWFDTVSSARGMPWRKPFQDLSSCPSRRQTLEKRAYEVWISEIMLQQTRVSTVIDYWTRWMDRFPTIQALAAAPAEEVVPTWRGLGYYSRCTRIHEAAKLVCEDPEMRGLLPGHDVVELEKRVPGVGRYTAGAIVSIVWGRPEPMVDGNVLRVLSRQLGVLGDVSKDKRVVDLVWEVAGRLVKMVAVDGVDGEEKELKSSDRPGRWGQALMELGSTVCTPLKPNCAACPVTETCRAYQEGYALAVEKGHVSGARNKVKKDVLPDIEDLCTLCTPYEEVVEFEEEEQDESDSKKKITAKQQQTLSRFFNASISSSSNGARTTRYRQQQAETKPEPEASATETDTGISAHQPTLPSRALKTITKHAQLFPLKKKDSKKPRREEELLVCAVRRASDGYYLLQKRPEKGTTLAGLWELPSHILSSSVEREEKGSVSTAKERKAKAVEFVSGILGTAGGIEAGKDGRGRGRRKGGSGDVQKISHKGELGTVPWLFSHVKLTMHVHLFEVDDVSEDGEDGMSLLQTGDDTRPQQRWASSEEVEQESMGTGMRKCWALVGEC